MNILDEDFKKLDNQDQFKILMEHHFTNSNASNQFDFETGFGKGYFQAIEDCMKLVNFDKQTYYYQAMIVGGFNKEKALEWLKQL